MSWLSETSLNNRPPAWPPARRDGWKPPDLGRSQTPAAASPLIGSKTVGRKQPQHEWKPLWGGEGGGGEGGEDASGGGATERPYRELLPVTLGPGCVSF